MTPRRVAQVVLMTVLVLGVLITPWRGLGSRVKNFAAWQVQAGTPDQTNLMIEMSDGVRLATDVYLPGADAPLPTVLMRLPYGKRDYGEVRFWVDKLVSRGFAVVVQDMRGRYGSEGVFAPYPNAGPDGAATLDWIVAQPWSNGRVGTLGCSALGESQLMLAAQGHPAHRAMVPIASGGAIGSLGGSYGYFGAFEGGVFGLAASAGWFGGAGGKTAEFSGHHPIEPASALPHLPLIDVVARMRSDPTDYEDFLRNFGDANYWRKAGYVTGQEPFATPALFIDSWHDPGIRSTFLLAKAVADRGVETHMIATSGTHCGYMGSDQDTVVGDLPVSPQTRLGFVETIIGFLNQHLADGPVQDLPRLSYYALVEDRWRTAVAWPPATARPVQFYLAEGKSLSQKPPTGAPARWSFISDPFDPVPSIGGALCCTGDPNELSGPVFQNAIEDRADVLVFTSAPLNAPMLLAGPIWADLTVSADVLDTDLVLRVTDVDTEGRSLLLQEGALRLRYRNGIEQPALLTPGQSYQVRIELRDIAYLLESGHRLRLGIAGSSFPRLERNLNTGGRNYDETEGQVAHVTLSSGAGGLSSVTVHVLSD